MIHPEIQWPPAYEPALADGIVSNEIEVKDLTPEEIWPYLTNISDWNRFSKDVMDATFIDPSIEDPHLFPKAEFTYKEAGLDLAAHTLEVTKPKDDRAGRISWEGNVTGGNEARFSFCHAWLVAMGPGGKGVRILTEMSIKGNLASDTLLNTLHTINGEWLEGLVKYVTKHLTETNHPRNPADGSTR